MARLQAASADLEALAAGDAGPLRIGTYQSVGARILPGCSRASPPNGPRSTSASSSRPTTASCWQLVERGEADVSFCVYPLEPGPFEAVELMPRPVRARRRQPLAARWTRQAADPPRRSSSCR